MHWSMRRSELINWSYRRRIWGQRSKPTDKGHLHFPPLLMSETQQIQKQEETEELISSEHLAVFLDWNKRKEWKNWLKRNSPRWQSNMQNKFLISTSPKSIRRSKRKRRSSAKKLKMKINPSNSLFKFNITRGLGKKRWKEVSASPPAKLSSTIHSINHLQRPNNTYKWWTICPRREIREQNI